MGVVAPSGTITFLFTDIEGSTRLWQQDEAAMRSALERHDAIVHAAIEGHGGYVFSTGGDGFGVAFARAGDAVAAAVEAQAALGAEPWPDGVLIRVRMGVHTGEVTERDGDYFGTPVNQTARLMAVGHGGQVLCSQTTAALLGAGVAVVDLGEHWLRDASAPQRVFQVGGGAFAPLRSVNSRPSNLPAELSAFVGREEEIGEVVDALGGARVVTLTGVGGVGKTRLALRAAALLARHRDGVWFVELAPLADGGGLVEVVAGVLGVPERPGRPLAASVVEFLRAKDLLVVLDNCEHLGDAVGAWVTTVLASAPEVRVLATSRRRLGVRGERVVTVSPLGLPPVGATAREVAEADAARLFAERAAEIRGSFAVTDANASAVGRLVRLLDGIPLAIELAAARVRSQTPAELADLFERTGTAGRYEPLRRAIDWSYGLLTDEERTALNRAAVFAGDFGLAAGEAVIGTDGIEPPDVVELLGGLVDHSLLVAEDRAESTRFRLLETIRQYALERLLAVGEDDVIRRRHAGYYATFAETAGEGLRGADEAMWTERVMAEIDDLRATVTWAAASGEVGLSMRVLAALYSTVGRVGNVILGWATPVVEADGARGHTLYPTVKAIASLAHCQGGRIDQGERDIEDALAACDELGVEERERCGVLNARAWVASIAGRYDDASEWIELSLASARATGDDNLLAGALTFRCANLAATRRDPAEARRLGDEALTLSLRLGNPTRIGFANLAQGMVRVAEDPEGSLSFFVDAAGAFEAVRDDAAVGACVACQAWISYESGDVQGATHLFASALDRFQRSGVPEILGGWLGFAALLLEAHGDDDTSAMLRGSRSVVAGRGVVPIVGDRLAASEDELRRRVGSDRHDAQVAAGRAMGPDELLTFVGQKFPLLVRDEAGP